MKKQVFNPYLPSYEYIPDGKYYLYYCLDFLKEIGVAVCDEPAGEYEFLGFVRWETFTAPLQIKSGKSPLYFTYTGEGYADFMSFTLSKK